MIWIVDIYTVLYAPLYDNALRDRRRVPYISFAIEVLDPAALQGMVPVYDRLNVRVLITNRRGFRSMVVFVVGLQSRKGINSEKSFRQW